MNLGTSFAILFALSTAPLVAQDASAPVPPNPQQLTPVNQLSRFMVVDTLPRLANGMTGAVADSLVLRAGEFRREDQTIVTQVPQAVGKQAVWVQMSNYWIEPITPPPSQGDSLVVPIDDMRMAEVQGVATLVTPPAADSKRAKPSEIDANENMEVPDGAILKTADGGSVAVMVGGHTSIRLVPNSTAQFKYDSSGDTPRLIVKLIQGAAFCKVGKLPSGRHADVAVQGLTGELASIGSADFFVETDPVSLHACVVQGKLLVGNSIPLAVGNMGWYPADVQAEPATGPQICHWPQPTTEAQKISQDSQILNLALRQSQSLNVKINALLTGNGDPLSSDDQAYLAKIPRITWYARATATP